MTETLENLQCTFCKKRADEVRKIICGPSVFICDECTDLFNEQVVKKNPNHLKIQKRHQMETFVIHALGLDEETCTAFLKKYRQLTPELQDAFYTLLSSR